MESGDGVCLASDVRNVVAGFLDHPLLTVHRAASPAYILGCLLDLLFPCHAEQPVHAMLFAHELNRPYERASSVICRLPRPRGGVRVTSLVSAWHRRFSNPAACCAACMGERTINTRSCHAAVAPAAPGASQVRSNRSLGRQHLVPTVVGTHYAF